MFGCFIGGWAGDKFGRKKGVWMGSLMSILGAALMAASVNSNMFICARVIAGLGIGFINVIVPPWVSELSQAHNRGASFARVFTSNCASRLLRKLVSFMPLTPVIRHWYRPCLLDQLWDTQFWRKLQMAIPAGFHGHVSISWEDSDDMSRHSSLMLDKIDRF
jgi:hypothetical protein